MEDINLVPVDETWMFLIQTNLVGLKFSFLIYAFYCKLYPIVYYIFIVTL